MDIEQSAKNRLLTAANNVFNYSISETWLTVRQVESGSFIGLTLVSLKTFVMASEKFRAVDIDIHILERALGRGGPVEIFPNLLRALAVLTNN